MKFYHTRLRRNGGGEVVQPVCQTSESSDEYADWTTPLLPAADGDSVYMAFGYSSSCLQRWDLRTLKLDWNAGLPEAFAFNIDTVGPLLTADTLFLASGPQVLAVAVTDGAVRSLVQDDDYEFAIEAWHAGDLVLRAQRTRGSTHYALQVVDADTGTARWTYDLADSPPIDSGGILDENTPEWLVQPSDAGLRLLRFQAAEDDRPHAIINETLDWQTGQSSGQTTTLLGVPTIIFLAPAWTVWREDTLWMMIENDLRAFDAADNRVVFRWP